MPYRPDCDLHSLMLPTLVGAPSLSWQATHLSPPPTIVFQSGLRVSWFVSQCNSLNSRFTPMARIVTDSVLVMDDGESLQEPYAHMRVSPTH
jgi:hypothetical protein